MNIFEQATKNALRFSQQSGNLLTEDLWKIDLESLDYLYVLYSEELDKTTNKSLLKKNSGKDKLLQLRHDICKAIIESRLVDIEKAENAVEDKAKDQLIMQIINEKENEALRENSVEALREMMSKNK